MQSVSSRIWTHVTVSISCLYQYTFNLQFQNEYLVVLIFDKQNFISLQTIHHIFWYNPVSRKKDRTSSILTFLNRSIKLFTLKNRFLMRAKALHSIRMCLMMQGVRQVKHCGCCSCFSMKERVSLVWPMRNRDIMTCSLLDFLKTGLHSPKVGWIWKSLLWMLFFHSCYHFVEEQSSTIRPIAGEIGVFIPFLRVLVRK